MKHFRTKGGATAWFRPGEGSPFVFLHGLGCSKEHFVGAFAAESGRGRRLFALDLPGCGDSARLSDEQNYTAESQAVLVREALLEVGCGEAVLVFHSLSTLLLAPLLRDLPGVRGVVLLEGNLLPEDTFWSSKIAEMDELSFARYFTSLQRGGRLMMRTMLKAQLADEDLLRLGSSFARIDKRAFREWAEYGCAASRSGEILTALANFSGPKLYIRGAASDRWNGGSALVEAGVEFLTIAGAGHFPHIDNPVETYEAVFGLPAIESN